MGRKEIKDNYKVAIEQWFVAYPHTLSYSMQPYKHM